MKKFIKIRNILMIIVAPIVIIPLIFALLNPTPKEDDGVPRPDIDTFKIEELTEEQITKIPEYRRSYRNKEHHCGNGSGLIKVKYKDYDYEHTRISYEKITGISVFSATQAKNTTLTLDIKSKLGAGNAKLLIIRDGEIIEIFECGEDKRFVFEVEGESLFYVKGLFESAEDFEITVWRAFDGEEPVIDH